MGSLGSTMGLVENMLDLHRRLSEAKTGHEKTLLSRRTEATDRQIDGARPRALRPLGGGDRHRRGRRPVTAPTGGRGLRDGLRRLEYILDRILVIRYNCCILDGRLLPGLDRASPGICSLRKGGRPGRATVCHGRDRATKSF